MSTPRWQKIKELVDKALDLAPAERAAYLEAACPDPELRAEVESLLAHETPGFLDRPAAAGFDSGDDLPSGAATAVDLTGDLIDHYRIEGKLGRGGMGEVWLAQDQQLDRRVALKLLGEDLRRDESAAQRFFREARSAAALDHPYICKIFEIGQAAERPFIAMEYVVGETLGEHIKAKPLPLKEALGIAGEIAEALEAAHQAHIVHRDLKPSNIMLTVGGHVKVLDFGLAKRVAAAGHEQFETASRHTATGMTLGTLAYMAPEQLRGQPIDARADIFAFGILLFEMFTGKHPFERDTPMDSAAAILTDEAPPPSRYRRDAPPLLDEIVAKMLAKNADDRYANIGEVRAELARLADGQRPDVGPASDRPSTAPRGSEAQPADPLAAADAWTPLTQTPGGRALVVILALVVVAAAIWNGRQFLAGRLPPSVAVLPATFLGDEDADAYWAHAVGFSVANRLSRAGLRVASPESTLRYAGSERPAAELAREIGVDAVVTGGFRMTLDEIRITSALTRADGEVGWRDTLEVPWEQIADIEAEIAIGAAQTLLGGLDEDAVTALSTPESSSIVAYDHFLQGVNLLLLSTAEANRSAPRYFLEATAEDPGLVGAYAAAGMAYSALYDYGEGGAEMLDLATAQLEQAIARDPGNVPALQALASVDEYRGWSESNVQRDAEIAASTAPYDAAALLTRVQALATAGLVAESMPLIERAIELEPVNEMAWRARVIAHLWLGEFEGLIETADRYRELFGDELEVRTYLALAHQALGNDAAEHHRAAVTLARQTESAGGAAARAFLYAGIYFNQQGREPEAPRLWQDHLRTMDSALTDWSAGNPGVLLYRAAFELLLGHLEVTVPVPEAQPGNDIVPYQLASLAATYAHLGEVDRAADVLSDALAAGATYPAWMAYVRVAAPGALESPELQVFVADYEERLDELRALR